MLDQLELNGGRFNGGQNAPIGSYFNPRTGAIYQQTTDGLLPQAGTWIPVTTSGTSSLAQCATALNGLVAGLAYTSANLHAYNAGTDVIPVPGQMTNDA